MKLKNEGMSLEYKTAANTIPKEFWNTYSAFANTQGGEIWLGIDESKKFQYSVTGVKDSRKILTDLYNQLGDKNKISANLITEDDVITEVIDHKKVIKINVRPAPYDRKPVYVNGHKENCYIRYGDGDHTATEEQFKYMVVNSSTQIDGELLSNYTIEDLNTDDIDQYRNIIVKNTGNKNYLKMDYEEFLYSMGAIKTDRSSSKRQKKLTVACLLFFGKYNAITDRFKSFQLDFFKRKSSIETNWMNRMSSGDMNFPEMNIFSFYRRVLTLLEEGIPDKYTQDTDLTRGSYHSDMMLAIKEALVNSLMHAYYDSSEPIVINDYSDYYEFNNPGDMRVSKEEFIHGNNPVTRNSIISILFRRVGIAERAGSGGPRIFESAAKNHLKLPEIIKRNESTTIRIWKIDLLESLSGLKENQKIIVKFAIDNTLFKVKDIVNSTELSEFKARDAIKKLTDSHILVKFGNGKATEYSLNQKEETGMLGLKMLFKHVEDNWNK